MEDVLDVYHRPYDEARPLICIDEQPTQLVSEARVPLPPRPGTPTRYDYEYNREGVANLFMLFQPLLGCRRVVRDADSDVARVPQQIVGPVRDRPVSGR
jgi:hypothetical protein